MTKPKLLGYSFTDEMLQFIREHRANGFSWPELADAFNEKFQPATKKSGDNLRKTASKYKHIEFSETHFIDNLKQTHRTKKTNSKTAKENRTILDNIVEMEDFLKEYAEIERKAPVTFHKQVKLKKPKVFGSTVISHISDTHIGVEICEKTMGGFNKFDAEIAARRFAKLFREIADYKKHRRKDQDLVLVINGDILAGIIHDQEWGVLRMASQMSLARRIFIQGISYVAAKFSKVTIHCTTGNHDRFIHKGNKGRQTSSKWDSFGTNLYTSLRDAFELADYKNVEFNIPETPYVLFKVQGHTVFATHGDTVINVGNISKTINISNIKEQINDIMAALGMKIDIVMIGHVHKATYQVLDNGVALLINGNLSGVDEFCQSIGILKGNIIQQIFEVTKKYPVGDIRFVELSEADNNKELEKIIKPIKGLF